MLKHFGFVLTYASIVFQFYYFVVKKDMTITDAFILGFTTYRLSIKHLHYLGWDSLRDCCLFNKQVSSPLKSITRGFHNAGLPV